MRVKGLKSCEALSVAQQQKISAYKKLDFRLSRSPQMRESRATANRLVAVVRLTKQMGVYRQSET
ncbi:MAG: hypothetical protein J1F28_07625 [Oscillospiraceae bacterium]|nr:hypothetical protein [Oscillospiraceae bacterium]